MGDNPFELEDDEEETEPQPDPKQSNQLNAAQRKLAKAEKELEELRQFKADQEKATRTNSITETFKEIGLNPKWAKFYQGEEVTPETIKAWAVAEDFITLEATGSAETAEAPTGYTPTVIPEGQTLGAKVFTPAEFKELARSDPGQAQKVFNEGRVNMAAVRQGLGPDK